MHKKARADKYVVHIETWSDSLVGTDNTGLCEVVAEYIKLDYVDTA